MMDLEGITLTEISQTEKDKYHMISLICRIKKQKQNKTSKQRKQNRNRLIDTEIRLVVTREEGGWGWAKWVNAVNCMVTDSN